MKVLLQLPSIVQPVAMSVFMETQEPYLSRKADNDVLALAESFSVVGISTTFLSDALFNNNGPHVPMEDMRQLSELAVRFTDDVPEIRSRLVCEQLDYCSRQELAGIIINQPKLRLHYDEELGRISPDSTYESYEVNPLFGLLFPRDHFINVGGQPVFGRLKRQDRSREVDVVKKVVSAHGHKLIEMDHVLEGGDYQENELVSIINFGFRTEEQAVDFLIASGLLQTDIVLAVQDTWCNPEQFHLDHYVCLLRDTLLIDAKRAEEIDRSKVCIYRRTPSGWRVTEDNLTLLQAAQIVGIEPVLLDEGMMKAWCANAFSIGDHIWIDNAVPPRLIELLSARDYNIHTHSFSEHQKQFGGIHCSTQLI